MKATVKQQKRVEQELSQKAGEPVEVQFFDGGFDVFCQSELGAFRVREGYVQANKFYSSNLDSWVVSVHSHPKDQGEVQRCVEVPCSPMFMSLGRSSWTHTKALHASYIAPPYDYPASRFVLLNPITVKGEHQKCEIRIPPEAMTALAEWWLKVWPQLQAEDLDAELEEQDAVESK